MKKKTTTLCTIVSDDVMQKAAWEGSTQKVTYAIAEMTFLLVKNAEELNREICD